jgi:hypothetical protein
VFVVEQWTEYGSSFYGITGSPKGEKVYWTYTVVPSKRKVLKIIKYEKTEEGVWAVC